MINEKQEILATVNTLPDDTTWDDAIYTLMQFILYICIQNYKKVKMILKMVG